MDGPGAGARDGAVPCGDALGPGAAAAEVFASPRGPGSGGRGSCPRKSEWRASMPASGRPRLGPAIRSAVMRAVAMEMRRALRGMRRCCHVSGGGAGVAVGGAGPCYLREASGMAMGGEHPL